MTGSYFNLSSASQLATALYTTLNLPPPQQRSDRYADLFGLAGGKLLLVMLT